MSEKIAMRRSRFTDGLQVLVEHFDDGTRLVFVSFTDGDLAEAAPGVVMFGEEFDQLVEFVNAPFDRVRDAVATGPIPPVNDEYPDNDLSDEHDLVPS